jgi:hypothetical protein
MCPPTNALGYLAAQGLADQIYTKDNAIGPANLSKGWLNFAELMMGITKDRQKTIASGKQYAKVAYEIMGDGMSLVLGAWMNLFSGESELAKKSCKSPRDSTFRRCFVWCW